MKICVFELGDKYPSAHINKQAAKRKVLSGQYYWAGRHIRRRAPEPPKSEFIKSLGYIPETLPMAELPGIRFVPPKPKPFEMPRFV